MRSSLALLILALSPVASAALSPRFAIGSPDPQPGVGVQTNPAIAANSNSFLAVWQQGASLMSIRGARISGSGTVVDPHGIAIGVGGTQPNVAWNGYAWAVTWWNGAEMNGCLLRSDGVAIRQRHVITKGMPIGAPLVRVGDHLATLAGFPLHLVLMSLDLDTTAQPGLNVRDNVTLTANGKELLLIDSGDPATPEGGVRFVRLDENGFLTGIAILPLKSQGPPPTVWSGDRYWALTSGSDSNNQTLITFPTDGSQPSLKVVPLENEPDKSIAAAPDGGAFLYAGQRVLHVSPSGAISEHATNVLLPRVATDGSGESVGIWQATALQVSTFDNDGVPRNPQTWLAQVGPTEYAPATDLHGDSTQIAFVQDAGRERAILMRDLATNSLTRVAVVEPSNGLAPSTGVATNGETTLVTWRDGTGIHAGQAERQFEVLAYATEFKLIWTGQFYALFSTDGRTSIQMTRLADDGTRIAGPITLATSHGQVLAQLNATPGGDGTILLTWIDQFFPEPPALSSPPSTTQTLTALRLSESGQPLEASPRTIVTLTWPINPAPTSVAWNRNTFTVVWRGGLRNDVGAARIDVSGLITPLALSRSISGDPQIAADGHELFLMWSSRADHYVRVAVLDDTGYLREVGGLDSYVDATLARVGSAGMMLLFPEAGPDFIEHMYARALTSAPQVSRRRAM